MPQTQVYDSFYKWSLGAELKFAWLPETCYISGKRIWLRYEVTDYSTTTLNGSFTKKREWTEWQDVPTVEDK